MYPYGLVGNCQTSALIGTHGAVEWMCAPRPDSPPVFGRLLDPDGGHFSIASPLPPSVLKTEQRYLPNTNVLLTTVTLPNGDAFQITDFCPRFEQYGRIYRPAALFRLVEPLQGTPVIQVSCRPVSGWEKAPVQPVRGSNHLRYEIRGEVLRLLTNMPLTYLCEETPVALTEKFYFGLTWGLGIEDDLVKVTHDFLEQTACYWRIWVKNCSVPLLHQQAVIRSALALKLHCFEDTGKSSRVIEVLLGSLSPTELMTGKIVGIGLVGLTQITVYAVTAGAVRAYVFVQQVEGDWTAILSSFTAGKMSMFFVFFILGYFMFTSLFAAIGAVCNSEQEAQNLQTPVVMCLVVPMILTFFFLNDPNRPAAVVLSLIPIFTPMLMYMRISLIQPPAWQVILSIVLTLGTIALLFRAVGKIFRIGILMYGKKPTIPEILRWARS